MLRKITISLVAVAAIAVTAMPTDVSARGHGGWRGGGSHSGWHGGYGGWRGGGWRGYGWGYYAPYAYGCYRTVRVATPFGWRWQRVWVCG